MSNTQMGRESIRLIKHLAENGPRTVTALLAAFPSENRHDLQRRLSNLEQGCHARCPDDPPQRGQSP